MANRGNRIFKFPLEVTERQMIHMPRSAQILSVVTENEAPVLYVLVDTNDAQSSFPRIFRGVTSGEVFNAEGCTFIGTAKLKEWYIFHVFEQRQGVSDPIEGRYVEDYAQIRTELRVA